MGFPENYKSKIDFRKKKMSSSGPYLAQGLVKGQNGLAGPTGDVARVRPRGGQCTLGASGGVATDGQSAVNEAHRRWLWHRGASRSSPDKEKWTMGSPCNVSTARWLRWRCAMTAAVSDEPWWSAMTLVVLYSSRRMGGHLGAGKFGGKDV
jgi:hypothetical protein